MNDCKNCGHTSSFHFLAGCQYESCHCPVSSLDIDRHPEMFADDSDAQTQDLQQQLDAANQRIAHLEGDKAALKMALESNTQECSHWAAKYAQEHESLKAANQRIAEMESSVAMANEIAAHHERAKEEAERKLATARAAVAKIPYRQCDEHGCKWRTGCLSCAEAKSQNTHLDSAIKSLVRIEQPQQQLPGDDPPFGMCQCPACVALRTWTETKA